MIIKQEVIIDWNNKDFLDFSLSGKPFWLETNKGKIIICCHFSLLNDFAFPEIIENLIKNNDNKDLEIICCYPTSAKYNKQFGKYIHIESNFPIIATYNNISINEVIATYSEKI